MATEKKLTLLDQEKVRLLETIPLGLIPVHRQLIDPLAIEELDTLSVVITGFTGKCPLPVQLNFEPIGDQDTTHRGPATPADHLLNNLTFLAPYSPDHKTRWRFPLLRFGTFNGDICPQQKNRYQGGWGPLPRSLVVRSERLMMNSQGLPGPEIEALGITIVYRNNITFILLDRLLLPLYLIPSFSPSLRPES